MRRWPIYIILDLNDHPIDSFTSIFECWNYLKNKLYFSMDFKTFKYNMKNRDSMIIIPDMLKNEGIATYYTIKRDYFFK